VVLCSEGTLASWLLVRDGHGEHSGLRGSGHQSITPYVHGRRVVLLKHDLTRVCLSLRALISYWHIPGSFIVQDRTTIMRLKTRQVAPGQVKPYVVGH
jgi:hypothetical protein